MYMYEYVLEPLHGEVLFARVSDQSPHQFISSEPWGSVCTHQHTSLRENRVHEQTMVLDLPVISLLGENETVRSPRSAVGSNITQ